MLKLSVLHIATDCTYNMQLFHRLSDRLIDRLRSNLALGQSAQGFGLCLACVGRLAVTWRPGGFPCHNLKCVRAP